MKKKHLVGTYVVFVICLLGVPYLFMFDLFGPALLSPDELMRKESYPQQLRLSFGDHPNERVLTFASPVTGIPVVAYGTESRVYTQRVAGESVHFASNENRLGLPWIHHDLMPGVTYYYVAMINDQISEEFSFTVPLESGQMKFLVFGDLGLMANAAEEQPVAVIHTGDIAYHLFDNQGMVGDLYLQFLEPVISRVPYMTCVGNHDRGAGDRYHHYSARFRMPGAGQENLWYSWNVGLIHFVALTTDHIDNRNKNVTAQQREWLLNDLREANANRSERPWVIVYGHHPMYCSNTGEYCALDAPVVRDELEDILMASGVDVYISSHQHSYERLWPVVKGKVLAHHYNNPKAPLQIISGSGGCPLVAGFCFDPTIGPGGPWSATRWWFPAMPGYDRMIVHNATHLTWQHVLSGSGYVVDDVTLVQRQHGPFAPS